MEDPIKFKGEFERRNVDIEFTVDGVGAVKVKLDARVEFWEFLGEPECEFGYPSSLGLVGVVPFSGTGFVTENIFGFVFFKPTGMLGNSFAALNTSHMDRPTFGYGSTFS